MLSFQAAFDKLDSIYGTYTEKSDVKSNFQLPRHCMTNTDLNRIINSDEVCWSCGRTDSCKTLLVLHCCGHYLHWCEIGPGAPVHSIITGLTRAGELCFMLLTVFDWKFDEASWSKCHACACVHTLVYTSFIILGIPVNFDVCGIMNHLLNVSAGKEHG